MATKKSFAELQQLMRDNGFSDEEMPQALKVLLSDKETREHLQSNFELAEPRKKPDPPGDTRNAAERFVSPNGGALQPLKPLAHPGAMGKSMLENLLIQWAAGHISDPNTRKVFEDKLAPQGRDATAGGLGGVVGLDAIGKEEDKGNQAGAFGQMLTQGAMLGLGGRGGSSSPAAKAASAGSEIDKFVALTDKITQPIQETLNVQGDAIKDAMQGHLSNVASLKGNPAFRKIISKLTDMEYAPNTKVTDVKALREALETMSDRINKGQATSWNDLFEMTKKVRQANSAIRDAATQQAVTKITDIADDELSAGAKQAGHNAPFEAWKKNYAMYRNLRRRYDEVLKGKADVQQEVKGTAKSTSRRVLGVQVGSPKVNKVAKVNSQMLKQAHKAFDELHSQIKGAPGIKKPPAATPTATTPKPPAGGGGTPLAPAGGGSGIPGVRPRPRYPAGSTPITVNPAPKPTSAMGAPMGGITPPLGDMGSTIAKDLKNVKPVQPGGVLDKWNDLE